MSNAKIFLVGKQKGESLIPMVETAFPKEDDVQRWLQQYWDLLPGDQIDPDNPRRWLLVSREMGVPGGKDEGEHWSCDHLFLDQDAIPTFVECKLAVNPEVRRKVVAQMLDYAANSVEYLDIDKLIEAARRTAEKRKDTIDNAVLQLIGKDDPAAIDHYWQDVSANLRSGKVRLIFVTDETPRELRRLVEFLNDKMTDVKLFIVEIKQFIRKGQVAGEEQTALVPRVIGATVAKIHPPALPPLNPQALLAKCSPEAGEFFENMWEKGEARGHEIYWAVRWFSVRAHLPNGGLGSFAYGGLSGDFQFYCAQVPLSDGLREELLRRFHVFTGKAPKTLTAHVDRATVGELNQAYDFILDEVDKILTRLGSNKETGQEGLDGRQNT